MILPNILYTKDRFTAHQMIERLIFKSIKLKEV